MSAATFAPTAAGSSTPGRVTCAGGFAHAHRRSGPDDALPRRHLLAHRGHHRLRRRHLGAYRPDPAQPEYRGVLAGLHRRSPPPGRRGTQADTWSAVPQPAGPATHEAEVDWICGTPPDASTAPSSARRLRAAGVPLGVAQHQRARGDRRHAGRDLAPHQRPGTRHPAAQRAHRGAVAAPTASPSSSTAPPSSAATPSRSVAPRRGDGHAPQVGRRTSLAGGAVVAADRARHRRPPQAPRRRGHRVGSSARPGGRGSPVLPGDRRWPRHPREMSGSGSTARAPTATRSGWCSSTTTCLTARAVHANGSPRRRLSAAGSRRGRRRSCRTVPTGCNGFGDVERRQRRRGR